MTTPATRAEWLTFLALGFMWGSSYLFIKLAVDSFGTFTLIALRLLIGAAFLWAVLRISRHAAPARPATVRSPACDEHHQHRDPVRPDHLGGAVGR